MWNARAVSIVASRPRRRTASLGAQSSDRLLNAVILRLEHPAASGATVKVSADGTLCNSALTH
jgi:hypothetical protein